MQRCVSGQRKFSCLLRFLVSCKQSHFSCVLGRLQSECFGGTRACQLCPAPSHSTPDVRHQGSLQLLSSSCQQSTASLWRGFFPVVNSGRLSRCRYTTPTLQDFLEATQDRQRRLTETASLSQSCDVGAGSQEFLPYYALPYVRHPETNPMFAHLFQDQWVVGLRQQLCDMCSALPPRPRPRLYAWAGACVESEAGKAAHTGRGPSGEEAPRFAACGIPVNPSSLIGLCPVIKPGPWAVTAPPCHSSSTAHWVFGLLIRGAPSRCSACSNWGGGKGVCGRARGGGSFETPYSGRG